MPRPRGYKMSEETKATIRQKKNEYAEQVKLALEIFPYAEQAINNYEELKKENEQLKEQLARESRNADNFYAELEQLKKKTSNSFYSSLDNEADPYGHL